MFHEELIKEILVFILTLLLILVAAKIIQYILMSFLHKLTKWTENKEDDEFVARIKTPTFWAVAFGILAYNSNAFSFLADAKITQNILITVLILFVARIFISAINLAVEIWGINFAKKMHSNVDEQLLRLSYGVITFLFYAIALIYILGVWNVEILPILGSLGVAGIAVALALQEPLQNLFGGVQLLLDRNIRKGDIVELATGQSGLIHDITLRSTRLKTWDGKLIIIPNKVMSNETITNISMPDKKRRVTIPFGVEYGTDPDFVKVIVNEEIQKIEFAEKKDPAPMILFDSMGDNALLFEVRIWINQLNKYINVKQEAITKIYDRLNFEGIGIPFPQRTVWINDEGKAKHKKYAKKNIGTYKKMLKKTSKKSSNRSKK